MKYFFRANVMKRYRLRGQKQNKKKYVIKTNRQQQNIHILR